VFDLAQWDEVDAAEVAMGRGADHRWHAERRWSEARLAWLRRHPAAAAVAARAVGVERARAAAA
jgi:hypothetical protein